MMKEKLSLGRWLPIIIGWLLLGVVACTPEDEKLIKDEGVLLIFSQDTVRFDTVFTTVGSTTQWLQIYNPQNNAVNISTLSLGTSEDSPFQITVNGDSKTQFQDVRLRGGDSLLVLIEVKIDPQDTDLPVFIHDSIVFRTNGQMQDVKLEAWGQDAHFLSNVVITRDITFTGDRPYVVLDSLWVQPLATLTLAAGTRLYFNNQASLLVEGTLQAEGTPEARVQLQYIRDDNGYATSLGQWEGVLFGPESKNNFLNFTTIRNANFGVGINSPDNDTVPDITLSHTIIAHMAGYGVLAREADLDIYNTMISDCALGSILGQGRAYHRLRHCTLVNEDNRFTREDNQPLLGFEQDFVGPIRLTQNFSLQLLNCIVWGSLSNELLFRPITPENPIRLALSNTIIKSSDTTPLLVEANLYNQEPQFFNPATYEYRLDSLSPAVDAGLNLGIERDLEGNSRDAQPDIGAYEFIRND